MSRKRKAFTAGAVSLALAAGGLAMTAATAGGATVGCQALTSGNGECGSVALQFGHLALDDYQQNEYPGNKIILWTKSNADPAQDFYAAHYNPAGGQFTLEYARNGIRSGLCVTFPATGLGTHAELEPCNEGPFQTFTARASGTGGYYVITNQASKLDIDDNGYGNQGTRVDQWDYTGNGNQLWKPFG